MNYKNTENSFGLIAILIHWIMALIIIGLFILGKYMMDLDYYDANYQVAPWWHKSFGLIIAFLIIFRIVWKVINPKVKPLDSYNKQEVTFAKIMQYAMYLLIIVCCISGVMISTAKGAGISFFDWFEVPAFISNGKPQEELAEEVHEFATLSLIILAGLHMLAAFKHHFIDKDITLKRIFTTKEKTQ